MLTDQLAKTSAPRVLVRMDDWMKILTYARLLDVEINGFMLVDLFDGFVVLRDAFITPQTVTTITAETDQIKLAMVEADLRARGEDPTTMRCQWHSHVHAAAYFSEMDMRSIGNFTADWLISLVVNRYGNAAARIDYLRPIRMGFEVPVEILVTDPVSDDAIAACCRDITENVQMANGGSLPSLSEAVPTARNFVTFPISRN